MLIYFGRNPRDHDSLQWGRTPRITGDLFGRFVDWFWFQPELRKRLQRGKPFKVYVTAEWKE